MADALTAKGRATRARLVAGAADVLREQGVAFTTLDDIRARTGTSKSQLFHYFPDGKDELLLAVAQFEADRVLEDQQPHLGQLDSWESWQQWRDVVVERYEQQGDQCPLGALFLQVGRSRPGARAIVTELMRQWQQQLADGIRALQANGLVSSALAVDRTAAALLAGIQGGVTVMMSTGDSTHLKAALDTGIEHLRSTVAPDAAPPISGTAAAAPH
ncbi:TetR/AcrR family transcriptional regulator [Streptomyces apricus]|uniref:TetR/AcrR family transcriptional regulator n=1 Tax=Streptomyces apricus TaxID=1828112 RepID=A0A5B0AJ22_9ACTN|nr:TetR/AcrR family transcriptional regulator [Streptomyces apricus]KAA0929767.1 TetR/AcrR family transcriptional regulator [Streptomyces apricus]